MPGYSRLRAELVKRLYTAVTQYRSEGRNRLPSIRVLAAEHKVAYETMWKAVDQCRREGLVTVSQGGALRLTGREVPARAYEAPSAARDIPALSGPKWEQVCDRLRRALVEGAFVVEPRLPSAKLLGVRFGASYPVIRKALACLCLEGALEPCRGGYAPARPRSRPGAGVAVLFTGAVQPDRQMSRSFSRNWDVLRALEQACIAAGLRLETVPLEARCRVLAHEGARTPERDISGYVFWVQGVDYQHAPGMAETLAERGKPVAVLDEAALVTYHCARRPQSLVRLFSLGVGPLCGAAVGRHLAVLGHRRVAYFSTLSGRQDRTEGLRRALTRTAGPDPVTVFHALPQDHQGRHHGEFARSAHEAAPAESREVWRQVLAEVRPDINDALWGIAHSDALAGAFEQACADPSLTAWVGTNDPTALACLRFLAGRGVRVPEQVSVAGFDDSTDAVTSGLTSYNFNAAGLAHAIVMHLLHPAMKRERGAGEWFEAGGYVVARASTGPAGGRPLAVIPRSPA